MTLRELYEAMTQHIESHPESLDSQVSVYSNSDDDALPIIEAATAGDVDTIRFERFGGSEIFKNSDFAIIIP